MEVIKPTTIDLASTNVADTGYSEYNSGTAYSANAYVKVTFESDGTTPIFPHKIFKALRSTTGDYPPDNPLDWLDQGGTNRHKMFDSFVSSQTENATSIDIVLNVSKVDRVCFLGLEADEVEIVVKDSGGSTIETITEDLTITSSGSYSEYFYGETEYKDTLIVPIAGYYLNMTLEVTITSVSTAKCGHLVVGRHSKIGLTEYGVSAGISDYSTKTTNDFGETEFVERAYAKTLDIDIMIDHSIDATAYDRAHRILSSLRATPAIWNANNDVSSRDNFVVYGYYKSFDLVANYATLSQCNLEIEGLI